MATTTTTTTTKATDTPPPLTASEASEAKALLAAAKDVSEANVKALQDTLAKVVKLAPSLDAFYRKVNGEHRKTNTKDLAASGFHAKVTTLVGRLGTKKAPVVWPLDADQTWAAKNYTASTRCFGAYRAKVATERGEATWGDYSMFAERFAKGHYDLVGKLTKKGKDYDDEQAKERFTKATKAIKAFEEIDWSNFLPEGASDAQELAFYRMLAAGAQGKAISLKAKVERKRDGKTILAEARKLTKKAIDG